MLFVYTSWCLAPRNVEFLWSWPLKALNWPIVGSDSPQLNPKSRAATVFFCVKDTNETYTMSLCYRSRFTWRYRAYRARNHHSDYGTWLVFSVGKHAVLSAESIAVLRALWGWGLWKRDQEHTVDLVWGVCTSFSFVVCRSTCQFMFSISWKLFGCTC